MSFKGSHVPILPPCTVYVSCFFYYIICSSSEKHSAPDLSVLHVIAYFSKEADISITKDCTMYTKQADEHVWEIKNNKWQYLFLWSLLLLFLRQYCCHYCCWTGLVAAAAELKPEQYIFSFPQQLPLQVVVQDEVSRVVPPICSVADSGGRCLPWTAPGSEDVHLCECETGHCWKKAWALNKTLIWIKWGISMDKSQLI